MDLNKENSQQKELTMSAARANVQAIYFILPILLIFIPVYVLMWPEQFLAQNLKQVLQAHKAIVFSMPLIMLLVIILGAVVHELLHGITWAIFCKNGFRSIKFGVHWKVLTPYCHCKEPLILWQYRLGGLMPGLLMGFLPMLAGILWGNFLLFAFGIFFSIAAGGDLLILWMLRKQEPHALVQDHPEKIGCYILLPD